MTNPNHLNNLMQEAQKMQQRMQEAQNQLAREIVKGEAGAGAVEILMNCKHEPQNVTISPALMDEDVDMLEDLVKRAIFDCNQKIEKISEKKIKDITSGLNIPTDFLGGDTGSGA